MLERDANCNPRPARIPAVVQVIPIIQLCDVNIVGLVPVVLPVLRIRVNDTDPIAAVLEARIPAHHHEGLAVDAERVTAATVVAVVVVRNAVAIVTASLLPIAVLGLPVMGAMLLPGVALFAFLCMSLLLRAP